MKKNVAIVFLIAVIVYLSLIIIRVENERYALFLSMCRNELALPVYLECLKKVQTRTHWAWHLFYALTDGV
jgi:hypothetical protein